MAVLKGGYFHKTLERNRSGISFLYEPFKGKSGEWIFYGHNDEKNQFIKIE
jgi:hypothetical protein